LRIGALPSWGPDQLISRERLLMLDSLTPDGDDGTSETVVMNIYF
jgi:hypothetical protein